MSVTKMSLFRPALVMTVLLTLVTGVAVSAADHRRFRSWCSRAGEGFTDYRQRR